MRKDDLMKSDLLSELVLLGGCVTILAIFAMVVIAVLTHTPSAQ